MYTISFNGQTVSLPDNAKAILTASGLEIINPVNTPTPAYIPLKIGPDRKLYRPTEAEFNADVARAKHQTVDTKALTEVVRSGNGHKTAKVRDLNDDEKNHIRRFFQAVNGEIRPDACVALRNSMTTKSEISIFQVTGFVTYMHGEIMAGLATVRNLPRYLAYLQSHRAMWAKYNSPKYAAMRLQNHCTEQLV
jgi:hypothetical protein